MPLQSAGGTDSRLTADYINAAVFCRGKVSKGAPFSSDRPARKSERVSSGVYIHTRVPPAGHSISLGRALPVPEVAAPDGACLGP